MKEERIKSEVDNQGVLYAAGMETLQQDDALFIFINDLIDNCDDAGATKISINCTNDIIKVEDNGPGISTKEEFKRAIAYSSSSKRNIDKDQNGRYGVGLKGGSVGLSSNVIITTKSDSGPVMKLTLSPDLNDMNTLDDWGYSEEKEYSGQSPTGFIVEFTPNQQIMPKFTDSKFEQKLIDNIKKTYHKKTHLQITFQDNIVDKESFKVETIEPLIRKTINGFKVGMGLIPKEHRNTYGDGSKGMAYMYESGRFIQDIPKAFNLSGGPRSLVFLEIDGKFPVGLNKTTVSLNDEVMKNLRKEIVDDKQFKKLIKTSTNILLSSGKEELSAEVKRKLDNTFDNNIIRKNIQKMLHNKEIDLGDNARIGSQQTNNEEISTSHKKEKNSKKKTRSNKKRPYFKDNYGNSIELNYCLEPFGPSDTSDMYYNLSNNTLSCVVNSAHKGYLMAEKSKGVTQYMTERIISSIAQCIIEHIRNDEKSLSKYIEVEKEIKKIVYDSMADKEYLNIN